MKQTQWLMNSKIGPLYLVASEIGLQGVFWKKAPFPFAESLNDKSPEIKILTKAVGQLEEYFEGKRKDFDIPFDIDGTPFQKQVWERLKRIPYGKTRSYSEIARQIKNDKAVRAVGSANGKNPLAIIVPCHRVIAANGALGGYAGGLSIKTRLLKLEESFMS